MMMDRRTFIKASSLASIAGALSSTACASSPWGETNLRHLIPLTNHDSILIKASFTRPMRAPYLKIGQKTFNGKPSDTLGLFWSFYATGLESGREYELSLLEEDGSRLVESWPLKTQPGLSSNPESMRVLIYTCAGGPDDAQWANGDWRFLPISVRRKLLKRALDFEPDLAIAVGDQTYWDQTISPRKTGGHYAANRERIYGKYGSFDADLPVFGSPNESVLTGCLDEQIGSLYGTDFRSVPLILTQDDHDYFENDEATDQFVTFPPKNFSARLGRAQQSLYFPEFLPDPNRPTHLAGSWRNGVSESYGSVKWGSLAEILLYDCRRFISLAGPTAKFVEEGAERWLMQRTKSEADARHLIHIPSIPFGWTAGKWGEWYPDVLQPDGTLGTGVEKKFWQSGWLAQHQRLLTAISEQSERIPLLVSGDLHAVAYGQITQSMDAELHAPVNTILSGSIGTGNGWPSRARGIGASAPDGLTNIELLSPREQNGFTLLDIDADGVTARQFAWDRAQGVEAINSMQPIFERRVERS